MHRRLGVAAIAGAALLILTGCGGASPEQQAVDVATEAAQAPYAQPAQYLCDDGERWGWNEESMGEWTDIEIGTADEVESRDGSYLVPVSWSHDAGSTSRFFFVDAEDMCVTASSRP